MVISFFPLAKMNMNVIELFLRLFCIVYNFFLFIKLGLKYTRFWGKFHYSNECLWCKRFGSLQNIEICFWKNQNSTYTTGQKFGNPSINLVFLEKNITKIDNSHPSIEGVNEFVRGTKYITENQCNMNWNRKIFVSRSLQTEFFLNLYKFTCDEHRVTNKMKTW